MIILHGCAQRVGDIPVCECHVVARSVSGITPVRILYGYTLRCGSILSESVSVDSYVHTACRSDLVNVWAELCSRRSPLSLTRALLCLSPSLSTRLRNTSMNLVNDKQRAPSCVDSALFLTSLYLSAFLHSWCRQQD